MAVYRVRDCGVVGAIGDYTQTGTYNGHPSYEPGGGSTWSLFWNTVVPYVGWVLYDGSGEVYFGGTSDTPALATWVSVSAPSDPPPTVTDVGAGPGTYDWYELGNRPEGTQGYEGVVVKAGGTVYHFAGNGLLHSWSGTAWVALEPTVSGLFHLHGFDIGSGKIAFIGGEYLYDSASATPYGMRPVVLTYTIAGDTWVVSRPASTTYEAGSTAAAYYGRMVGLTGLGDAPWGHLTAAQHPVSADLVICWQVLPNDTAGGGLPGSATAYAVRYTPATGVWGVQFFAPDSVMVLTWDEVVLACLAPLTATDLYIQTPGSYGATIYLLNADDTWTDSDAGQAIAGYTVTGQARAEMPVASGGTVRIFDYNPVVGWSCAGSRSALLWGNLGLVTENETSSRNLAAVAVMEPLPPHPDGVSAVMCSFFDDGTDTYCVTQWRVFHWGTVATPPAPPVPSGDTTPPTVDITSPADGSTVSGLVTVTGSLTDETALALASVYIDGALIDTEAQSGVADTCAIAVDLSTWANGTHSLVLRARDAAGNTADHTHAITVDNRLAAAGSVLYSVLLPEDASRWHATPDVPLYGMVTLQIGTVPTDERQRFNLLVGWAPTDTLVQSGYMLVRPGSAFPLYGLTGRVGMWAYPRYSLSYWETASCTAFLRVLNCDGRLIAIGTGPASVWEVLTDGTLSELLDLSTSLGVGAAYDACYADDKVYIGTDIGMVVFDMDAADESLLIRAHGTGTAVESVSAAAAETITTGTVPGLPGSPGGTPVGGTGTGSSNSTVYPIWMRMGAHVHKVSFPVPQLKSANAPANASQGGTLAVVGSEVYYGAAAGGVYRYTYGAGSPTDWTLVYDTAHAVKRLWSRTVGDTTELWVGAEHGIHKGGLAWTNDGLWTSGEARALAEWNGYVWGAGTIGGLWRRTAAAWEQYEALTGVSAVNDLLAVDSILYAATAYTGSKARLYALYIHEGGAVQCGPNPPDLMFQVLQYLRV